MLGEDGEGSREKQQQERGPEGGDYGAQRTQRTVGGGGERLTVCPSLSRLSRKNQARRCGLCKSH